MSLPTPYYQDSAVTIYHGDCREILPHLPTVDAVVTDPPYSSGGAMRSDRILNVGQKYQQSGTVKQYQSFSGDNRDQRSLTLWMSDWMAQALRITRPGGALLVFMDWRNLPCAIDAVQVGGWVFRSVVTWDKGSGRPDLGWFSTNQTEFLVGATSGGLLRGAVAAGIGIAQRGVLRHAVAKDKQHLTEKPVELLQDILRTRNDWGVVFDPFAGSGTTLRAAKDLGRKAIGIEIEERYCEIAARRCAQEVLAL